jgi:hypothetical protein
MMKGTFRQDLRSKTLFIVFFIVIVSIFIDTSIIKTSVYVGGIHGSVVDISIYTSIVVVYGVCQYLLLKYVTLGERFKTKLMNLFYNSVKLLQYVLLAILAVSIIQMLFVSSYGSIILKTVIGINYSISIVFLGFLSMKFISWFSSRRNKVVIAYAIAMILICINNALTIVDMLYELGNRAPEYIRPTKSSLANVWDASNIYSTTYFITSVLSFISIWFATVLLLQHYSAKIGKAKYWILVSIPLVYFLGQYQPLLVNLFTPLRLADPILFGITYI